MKWTDAELNEMDRFLSESSRLKFALQKFLLRESVRLNADCSHSMSADLPQVNQAQAYASQARYAESLMGLLEQAVKTGFAEPTRE